MCCFGLTVIIEMIKVIQLILGPLTFIIVQIWAPFEDLPPDGNAILASTIWIAIWWITEVIPIAVTSLLPLVLFPLTDGLELTQTAASYGHKLIFLYVGGFIIAIAIERWNLHKRIALNVIRLIGTNQSRMVLGFMLATAFLSMWISNTATSVMMLPIGLAIVAQLGVASKNESKANDFAKVLMLAIAYSASIGGISTLIGTPPNLVLAGIVQEFYHYNISFVEWFLLAFPISITLLLICWKYLTSVAFRLKSGSFVLGRNEIIQHIKALGNMSFEEKLVLLVFGLTALAWILRSFLLVHIFPAIDDSIIAVAGAITLFILPTRNGEAKLLTWDDAVKIPWGIILLFGGGLAIAEGFKTSGLADWIGGQMTGLNGLDILFILLLIVFAVNFLTEITSNVATTSMLLPVIAPMSLALDVHPFILMIGASMAASCAFMLPVATPPNAVVFGSGYLRIRDMVKTGVVMNIISVLIIGLYLYFGLELIWGIDIQTFPETFK